MNLIKFIEEFPDEQAYTLCYAKKKMMIDGIYLETMFGQTPLCIIHTKPKCII